MVDINEQIIREKEKLHSMLLSNDCEFQSGEILAQSKKVDNLITIYLYNSMGMDCTAATKTDSE